MSFRLFDEDNVKPYLVSAFFDILFSTASICVVQGFLYWGVRGSPPPTGQTFEQSLLQEKSSPVDSSFLHQFLTPSLD